MLYFDDYNRRKTNIKEKKPFISNIILYFAYDIENASFPECVRYVDVVRRIANVIYSPSYVSLHYTLCFYEMIPEAVTTITSVTTLKTCRFDNRFGTFVYQTVKPSFFFGYEPMVGRDGKGFFMATPEKALLDLLYLYPF